MFHDRTLKRLKITLMAEPTESALSRMRPDGDIGMIIV
jgi:hypothetical protein